MKTDDLIASLVADHPSRMQPVWLWLLAGLIAALPLSAVLFMMSLGPRPDIATAIHNPFFDLKFAVTLALASVAAALSLHLSRPNASMHGWMWLFALPLGLLGIGERHRRKRVDRRCDQLDERTELDRVVAVAEHRPVIARQRRLRQRDRLEAELVVQLAHRIVDASVVKQTQDHRCGNCCCGIGALRLQ